MGKKLKYPVWVPDGCAEYHFVIDESGNFYVSDFKTNKGIYESYSGINPQNSRQGVFFLGRLGGFMIYSNFHVRTAPGDNKKKWRGLVSGKYQTAIDFLRGVTERVDERGDIIIVAYSGVSRDFFKVRYRVIGKRKDPEHKSGRIVSPWGADCGGLLIQPPNVAGQSRPMPVLGSAGSDPFGVLRRIKRGKKRKGR